MSAAAEKIDFGQIPVIEVARELLGQENKKRSTSTEKHFPDHGGLFVNVEKNRWYSHGSETGGDASNLVQHATDCDFAASASWLRSHGFVDTRSAKQSANGSVSRRKSKVYSYTDANGKPLYEVVRYEPKDFRQRRPDGTWKGPDKGRAVPYRLPELLRNTDAPVLIVGGEKDVESLRTLGFIATCNHGGEGKWWPELTPYFKDRRVVILCDNDDQGEKHQEVVGTALNGVALEVRVVRFPHLPPGGDASDYLEQRRRDGMDGAGLKTELEERFRNAPAWSPLRVVASSPEVVSDWPEPVSLPDGLSPVDALFPQMLPEAIAPWVFDISERMQCPPDYVGIAALVGLGSVLGRKVAIRPQRNTDWQEVSNLWGCIVGRPGDLKSPAMTEALKPLRRLEVKAAEWFEAKAGAYKGEREIWELKRDATKNEAKRKLQKNAAAHIEPFAIPEPDEPVERRYITNDTTYEKLGEIMAQNPNGVLAHRDELVSLLKTLDREEYAPARGFFLTAWSGTQPYKFDRISRGGTHIEAACLGLLGSTQPGRLAEYVRRAHAGAAGDDGLIQRFSLLVWPDQKPRWEDIDRSPNSEAKEAAWRCFEDFDSLLPGAIGAETDQFETVPFLRFDEAAQADFLEWRKSLESKLRSDELTPAMASHLAKYRKLVPSLALINHLADGGTGPVNQVALLRALELAEYLESHAHRAYGAGAEAEVAAAKAILAHIRKGDIGDNFCARDIYRRGWGKLKDRDQVVAGLNLLSDLDWIVAGESGKPPEGGRPTTRYRINPRAR